MTPVPLSRTARLYSFTVAHTAVGVWKAPYLQAYVELPEGIRLFTLISNSVEPREDALKVGMPMELVAEPIDADPDGRGLVTYKFRPATP
jgi:uncharacterized OB-fold protein